MFHRTCVLAAVSALTFAGCTAYNLANYPEPESPNWEREPLEVAVIVPMWQVRTRHGVDFVEGDYFSSCLADALRSTGVFSHVEVSREVPRQGMYALPEPEPGRCPSEPMLTVLTAGVIPHVGCSARGYRFTLKGPPLAAPVKVDTLDSVSAVWGFFAPLLYAFPNWTYRQPDREEQAQLRHELITKLQFELPPR